MPLIGHAASDGKKEKKSTKGKPKGASTGSNSSGHDRGSVDNNSKYEGGPNKPFDCLICNKVVLSSVMCLCGIGHFARNCPR